MVKLGIIGAGNMGKNHIRLAKEMNGLFDLCAVYDPDNERISQQGLTEIAVSSLDELIDMCDAVVLAAPSSLHKDIALKVAGKRKHLLVEKPIALTLKDASEIKEAYYGIDRVLMVGHVERFNGTIVELEKVLKKEEIIAVNMERCSSMDDRIQDTDVAYDLMIHDADILLNSILPGQKLKGIEAFGTRVYSQKFMDYVNVIACFENGAVASVISSRATEDKIRKISVHCREAYVQADLLDRKISISRSTILKNSNVNSSVYKQENIITKVFVPNVEPLRAELSHFHNCITTGEKPVTGAESAIESMRFLEEVKAKLYG